VNKKIASVLGAALLLAAADASAQDVSPGRGVMLGAFGNLSAIQLDEDGGTQAENGPGVGVVLGYGARDGWTFFARGSFAGITYEEDDGSELDGDGTYSLGIVELGARYGFGSGPNSALRLYGEFGLSGTALSDEATLDGEDVEFTFSGPAIMLGGGVEYDLNQSVAVDVGMILGKGRFTSLEVDGETFDDADELDFTTVRLNAGIIFRP
jgi:opacity protein-like surface antigen